MKIRPSRQDRQELLSGKRKRSWRRKPKDSRKLLEAAKEGIDGLSEAVDRAADFNVNVTVSRLLGRGAKQDCLDIAFHLQKFKLASWYPSNHHVYIGGQKLLAVTPQEALDHIVQRCELKKRPATERRT